MLDRDKSSAGISTLGNFSIQNKASTRLGVFGVLSVGIIFIPTLALADCTSGGGVATCTGDTNTAGSAVDIGTVATDITVTNSGNITAGVEGIVTTIIGDGNISINSHGNIVANGDDGVVAAIFGGGDISINSEGNITAADEAILTNIAGDGDISISSIGDIVANGDDGIIAAVSGDGDISVNGEGSIASGGDAILVNVATDGNIDVTYSGNITSNSDEGIDSRIVGNGNVSINVTGNITAFNNGIETDADGIGRIEIIQNSGAIIGSTGIFVHNRVGNAHAMIDISGSVTGTNGPAIAFDGDAHDTVNLRLGSQIYGTMDFGNGNDGAGGANANDIDTLNVDAGINSEIKFASFDSLDTDLESAPENINLAGAGRLINGGTTLIVVDPTGFGFQSRYISDVTNSVFNLLDHPGLCLADSESGISYSDEVDGALNCGRAWVSGFGGLTDTQAEGNFVGFGHALAGVAAGWETQAPSNAGMLGFLAGYADSKIVVGSSSTKADVNSAFAGMYWKKSFGALGVNASFLAGLSSFEVSRDYSGSPDAASQYMGFYYAPSLALSAPIEVLDTPLIVSGRASYVGLKLESYAETGASNPLTIGDRFVSVANLRGAIKLPRTFDLGDGDRLAVDLSTGIDTSIDAGSSAVNVFVDGTSFGFSPISANSTSGFVGLDIAYVSEDGLKEIASGAELHAEFNGNFHVTTQVRGAVKF